MANEQTQKKSQRPQPPQTEARKPQEDSIFSERDRELHDEKLPRSHHQPKSTEQ